MLHDRDRSSGLELACVTCVPMCYFFFPGIFVYNFFVVVEGVVVVSNRNRPLLFSRTAYYFCFFFVFYFSGPHSFWLVALHLSLW